MGVMWTKDQKKVIDLRDRNILVSAAAGSGKTAVLVERIMEIVCDEQRPVDVDRLLVVTFTKAAAAEMKERVGAAIRKRLEEQPNNGYLQKQEMLVSHAQITTIDSFCAYILRNHFGEIDLDPAFRVADEGELKLLKKEVLKELLEEKYAEKTPEFLHFVECYASGKSDEVLEELVLKLYEFSTSDPFPEEWLKNLLEMKEEAVEEMILTHVKRIVNDLKGEIKQAITLCYEHGGPINYADALHEDRNFLDRCLQSETYEECSKVIRGRSFTALSRKKMDASEEEKELVKSTRNRMKKRVETLEKQFFYLPSDLIFQTEKAADSVKQELVALTLEFTRRFSEKKRKRNIVDFSDIEHLTLQILVEKKDGSYVPTEIAKSYGEHFAEIMIDEYQDSNMVQELILTSVSKQSLGKNNLFMVGDVKQSIYRFRQARPELFMKKMETYTSTDSDCQRISLSKNFRSRKEVLETVNFLFERIMTKELGNIVYDQEAALYPGAEFPEPEDPEEIQPELLLLDLSEQDTGENLDKTELEAHMVAQRILELEKNAKVIDKKSGKPRPVKRSDIVILLRTMSSWSDTFSSVLGSYGITAVTGSSTGYFSAMEIQTILNYLKVLDNQKQDIPLTAVLHSPIGNLDSSEMAKIRSAYPEVPYYKACAEYRISGEEEELRKKLQAFWKMTEELRKKAEYLPIHKLLWEIYDKTAYEQLVRMQPNGAVRAENLQMLVQKALDYEATSYRGLFNFVRYIESLQKYEVDYGIAETGTGNENAVHIMSIHKSKGLEFPIVFVSGMSKRFNKQDSKERIAIHPELGLGLDAIDPEKRKKMPTLQKKVIQKQIELESLGEELRVLYVALTRPKEKLIMTGSLKDARSVIGTLKLQNRLCRRGTYESLCSGQSFLDWIIQVSAGELVPFRQKIVDVEMLVGKKVEQAVTAKYDYEALRMKKTEIPEDLKQRLEYRYPYEDQTAIPGKVSVSELKMAAMEEEVQEMFEEPQMVPYVPAFLREERKGSATERGNAYHKLMECMDLSGIRHSEQVKERIKQLTESGKLTLTAAETINAFQIYQFCTSNLCQRMLAAEKSGKLYKEQPFVFARPAKEINAEYDSEQEVLIQGIMDAYFEEDGQYVILDYKTDHVKTGEELVKRYEKQLQLYGQALEQITGKKVKELVLYSFCLGKEIVI